MASSTATPDRAWSRRRIGWSETIALILAALAWAVGAVAWIANADQAAALATAALPANSDVAPFDDRFSPVSPSHA